MTNAPVIMATMMSDEVASLPMPKAGIAVRAQGLGVDDAAPDPTRSLPSSDFAITNRDVLNDSAIGLGSINARIDDDGIIRRASLLFRAGENIYPTSHWKACGWHNVPARLFCALQCARRRRLHIGLWPVASESRANYRAD